MRKSRNQTGNRSPSPDAPALPSRRRPAGKALPRTTPKSLPRTTQGAALQLKRDRERVTPSDVSARARAGLSGSGTALPHRARMERAFGVPFGNVRAHTGNEASAACSSIGAQAYTVGSDVAFRTPAPSPGLVAHELTHVVQQSGKMQPKRAAGGAGDRYEAEADAVADRVTSGESVADVARAHLGDGALGGGSAIQKKALPNDNDGDGERSRAEDEELEEDVPEEALEADGDGEVQRARDTAWAGNHVEVNAPTAPLIGNLGPTDGEYPFGYSYEVRYLYLGDTQAGLDGPSGNVLTKGHRVGGLPYSASLRSTEPGQWKAWVHNPGGRLSKSMHAEESFTVVDPVQIDLGNERSERVYDFLNPIPLQMSGQSEVTFQLTQEHVHSRRVAINSSGSQGTSISEKMSFGVSAGLDNDAGSEAEAAWGMSSATQQSWQEQWSQEESTQRESSTGEWMKMTFRPGPDEEGRSRMLIPEYRWVEWDALVYPHDSEYLLVTGEQRTVVLGMLQPTGRFREMRSTDEGEGANRMPTEDAQTDINPNDTRARRQHGSQLPESPSWRTLPGAKWAGDDREDTSSSGSIWQQMMSGRSGSGGGSVDTLQFIRGPLSMEPAGRDYKEQTGFTVLPGNSDEPVELGTESSISLTDGMAASRSQQESGVTTNAESRSLSASPGIKGLGSVGTSLSFENTASLSSATGTGLSVSESNQNRTTVAVSHSVNRKPDQSQFILFTPLVNHKVFEVGYGARRPEEDRPVTRDEFNTFYVHTYKHSPIPHIKLFDISRDQYVTRGYEDWPDFTPV